MNTIVTMKPELDKAQNINALIKGDQIMLCKKGRRVSEGKYVYLWPSNYLCHTVSKNLSNLKAGNIEECIYNKDIYDRHIKCKTDHSIFLLSKEGAKYINENKLPYLYYCKDEFKGMKYFAQIEYYDINPYSTNGIPNIKLFEKLKKKGLFWLWDIYEGPLKLFTTKSGNTRRPDSTGMIAIYRVYKCAKKDVKITLKDIQGHGSAASLKEESHDKIMKSFDNYGLKPVLDDDQFNKSRKQLIKIIDDFGKF